MKRQARTTSGIEIFSKSIWRMLLSGVALLLLFTHQSYAGVICRCDHHVGSAHGCHEASHVSGSASPSVQEESDTHSRHSCAAENAVASDTQPVGVSKQSEVCCLSRRPVIAEIVTVSRQDIAPVIFNILPLVLPEAPKTGSPASSGEPDPPRSRLLYLALSCFMI